MNTILLQNLIESVLDDEALTDGLTDNDAQIIINWCIQEIEKLKETQFTENEIKEQAHGIKQKAQLVGKIANDIQTGESRAKIRKQLEQFLTKKDTLNQFLTLTESDKPLAEKIQRLLSIPE